MKVLCIGSAVMDIMGFPIDQKKEWKGNLNLILTNLKYDVDNRGIPKEFAAARTQCRQNCQRGGACHFCYTSMNFSRALDKAKDKKN